MARMNPQSEAARNPQLEARLSDCLGDLAAATKIYAYDRLASTMDLAHTLAAEQSPEGTIVWARFQSDGRGRLGRVWASPEGGVYFSLLLRPSSPVADTPQLSLVAGVATAEAIEESTGLLPSVRWPNDLLIDGRKVAGILVEAKSGAAVVGVGINLTIDPIELPEGATSLKAAGAATCDPYQLTGLVCRGLHAWYARWRNEGFAPIREALRLRCNIFGKLVYLRIGSLDIEGTAADLDERGRLLVRMETGLMHPVEMGEVTFLRQKEPQKL